MNRSVSEALRRLVSTRAENLCEYCLIDIADTFFGGEVDHIVSVKHSGATVAENLAYTCQPCTRNKGSDLGSIYWPSGQLDFNSEERLQERHGLIEEGRYPPPAATAQMSK
jgi:hypothetical protein